MRLSSILAALLCTVLLAACGSDEETTAAPAAAAGPAEQSAFPVTIEHKYGSTTIERAPERVVVVGLREQDPLLALGIVPVATTAARTGELPHTGSDTEPLLGTAGGLIVVGALIYLVGRAWERHVGRTFAKHDEGTKVMPDLYPYDQDSDDA